MQIIYVLLIQMLVLLINCLVLSLCNKCNERHTALNEYTAFISKHIPM